MKNYLLYENERNQKSHDLFETLVRRAFGDTAEILVAHHITFENFDGMQGAGESEPDEIPSADTLIFDHELMTKVFGEKAIPLMIRCAQVDCDNRDQIVKDALAQLN